MSKDQNLIDKYLAHLSSIREEYYTIEEVEIIQYKLGVAVNALERYADREKWNGTYAEEGIESDFGEIARKALKEINDK